MTKKQQYLANVLIVEDDRTDAALLQAQLEEFGCYVDRSSGLDVSEYLESTYDILFMDLGMPDINGFSIVETLRKTGLYTNFFATVIVSGSQFSEELRHKCMEYRVDGYLEKPLKQGVLEEILEHYLSHRAMQDIIVDGEVKGFFCKQKATKNSLL